MLFDSDYIVIHVLISIKLDIIGESLTRMNVNSEQDRYNVIPCQVLAKH